MTHQNFPDDIYREHILELYKNPENFGILKNPDYEKEEVNETCGDEIKVQISVKNNKINDAKFQGSGCVLSIVSASLLTNKIKGMSLSEVKKLNKNDILDLLKIKITPARMNCVLLPLRAVQNSLDKKSKKK